ncbi:SDR family NAD(P)-dependent oxidoreductase [Humibacter sp. RRB41]|uniref:SDR family NAD(P)-dependent oxidoreductase n=1 Tax=Humibacter sp. RRB41 TaxID=2919946 RepID=UPI001FAA51F7|nr:SDR family NAD(P)-dependent oxidoreductase [Humibacter sp. RRB41]
MNQSKRAGHPKTIVISGGTDGMGRGLALARARRGDTVIAIGSSAVKGNALLDDAARIGGSERIEFIRADLSSVAESRVVVDDITERYHAIDVLALFANRQAPVRVTTAEGLEQTFALYYLSRYLLSHGLAPLLDRGDAGVIVNVAGVGMTKGEIHWDDLQLQHSYGMMTAQLQAGRANDLLGVALASEREHRVRSVLYHPGFTRSGDLSMLPVALRTSIRAAARLSARPIAESIAPIHGFIDAPPSVPLSAVDRGKVVPLTLRTLDPADARRLDEATRALLASIPSAWLIE